ncbi:MAG TPA: aldo/keto reductase [Chloroflexaceae bacterium]|nr:aldo/keto reductase [Chloroflexaceae bacterium]
MEYRQLGKAGVRVSAIGLGTNRFGIRVDQQGVSAIVAAALELGITFFDTADVYQEGRSEESLGVALKGRRQRAILATKVASPMGPGPNDHGASRQHIMGAVEASLRRMQTDYIDLYQIHRWDPDTPIEETLRALDDLVRAGKVRYVGASNFAAWQLAQANLLAELRGWTPFVSIQPHYHMLERRVEQELLPYCRAGGVGVLPYFPLAGGFLTGKYRRGAAAPAGSRGESSEYVQKYMTEAGYATIERLETWAAERGRSLGELAHAWLLAEPRVSSVISGATSVEQVRANARAADWQLSDEDRRAVAAILDGAGA